MTPATSPISPVVAALFPSRALPSRAAARLRSRGLSVWAADVAAGAQSLVTDQVTNGVAVRMALLYLLAGAPETGGG